MNRPPAYQCYASDLLASEWYFTMSAETRGVYHSICLGCWVNDTVPAEPDTLAAFLRLDRAVVSAVLPGLLQRKLVVPVSIDPTRLHVPALTDQIGEMMESRKHKADAGRKGGQATQRNAATGRSSNRSSTRLSDCSSSLSRGETRRDETKRTEVYRQFPSSAETDDEWVRSYEAASE